MYWRSIRVRLRPGAALVDENQCIVSILSREFPQIYPEEGWVEHDPMDIWSSQYGVMMEVVAKSGVAPEDIAAIGITNQRETTIVWDRETGRPVYNAIVWAMPPYRADHCGPGKEGI